MLRRPPSAVVAAIVAVLCAFGTGEVLAKDPPAPEAARACFHLQRMEEAAGAVRQAVKPAPGNARYYFAAGMTHICHGIVQVKRCGNDPAARSFEESIAALDSWAGPA